jgi:hypothetical protein
VYSATTYILRAGADVLTVGGFSGQAPFPRLTQFEQYVASGQARYVYLTTLGGGLGGESGQTSVTAESQIAAWVPAHCAKVPASDYGGSASASSGNLYQCTSA